MPANSAKGRQRTAKTPGGGSRPGRPKATGAKSAKAKATAGKATRQRLQRRACRRGRRPSGQVRGDVQEAVRHRRHLGASAAVPGSRLRGLRPETRSGPDPVQDRRPGYDVLKAAIDKALAAFVLTVEKMALLKNSTYVPTCSINPILSCGSIMTTGQAEVFGFATFPVVAATGAALLAGARLPRWWWLTLQAGTIFGIGFVHWLFYQSLYRIGALCPYCMIVWVVMIVLFTYLTLHNLER